MRHELYLSRSETCEAVYQYIFTQLRLRGDPVPKGLHAAVQNTLGQGSSETRFVQIILEEDNA